MTLGFGVCFLVGGVVGASWGRDDASAHVSNCFSMGSISGILVQFEYTKNVMLTNTGCDNMKCEHNYTRSAIND